VRAQDTLKKDDDVELDSFADLKHVRLHEVARLLICGQRTWLRWVAAGGAPKPIHSGERGVAWRVRDLEQWLQEKHHGAAI
jgi:predicted DNA-binding transcriptional regulator AlpA